MEPAEPSGGDQPKPKRPSELARTGPRPRKAGEGKRRRYDKKVGPNLAAHKRDRNALAREQRLEKVATLRIEGHSLRAIAKQIGGSLAQTHADVQEALERTVDRTNNAIAIERALSLQRIDLAIKGVMSRVKKGDDAAITSLTRLDARRAKLLGLDVPIKAELTGPDGGAIPIVAPTSQLESKLDDLFKRLAGGAPSVSAATAAPSAGADGEPAGNEPS
jgi:hypothetical protein